MNTLTDSSDTAQRIDLIAGVAALMEVGLLDGEQAADALLEAEGALNRACGTYTGLQLARRMRLECDRLPVMEEEGVPEQVIDYLVTQRLNELVSLANLKPMEEICLRMLVSGLSTRAIAGTLRIGRRRVEMHLRIARRKAGSVYHDGPYAGWYEVYLSEVRRRKS